MAPGSSEYSHPHVQEPGLRYAPPSWYSTRLLVEISSSGLVRSSTTMTSVFPRMCSVRVENEGSRIASQSGLCGRKPAAETQNFLWDGRWLISGMTERGSYPKNKTHKGGWGGCPLIKNGGCTSGFSSCKAPPGHEISEWREATRPQQMHVPEPRG